MLMTAKWLSMVEDPQPLSHQKRSKILSVQLTDLYTSHVIKDSNMQFAHVEPSMTSTSLPKKLEAHNTSHLMGQDI